MMKKRPSSHSKCLIKLAEIMKTAREPFLREPDSASQSCTEVYRNQLSIRVPALSRRDRGRTIRRVQVFCGESVSQLFGLKQC